MKTSNPTPLKPRCEMYDPKSGKEITRFEPKGVPIMIKSKNAYPYSANYAHHAFDSPLQADEIRTRLNTLETMVDELRSDLQAQNRSLNGAHSLIELLSQNIVGRVGVCQCGMQLNANKKA